MKVVIGSDALLRVTLIDGMFKGYKNRQIRLLLAIFVNIRFIRAVIERAVW
jgi:hypothetical protein